MTRYKADSVKLFIDGKEVEGMFLDEVAFFDVDHEPIVDAEPCLVGQGYTAEATLIMNPADAAALASACRHIFAVCRFRPKKPTPAQVRRAKRKAQRLARRRGRR